MKRTRAEPNPPSKIPCISPKAQKKSNPNPKPARPRKATNAAAAAAVKTEAVAEEEYLYPTPAAEGYHAESKGEEAEEERLGLGFGDGEGFGLWCGSVEEEVLLGWFPWTGPVAGEEEEGDFDIWQLQQIHEIPPGTAK